VLGHYIVRVREHVRLEAVKTPLSWLRIVGNDNRDSAIEGLLQQNSALSRWTVKEDYGSLGQSLGRSLVRAHHFYVAAIHPARPLGPSWVRFRAKDASAQPS